MPKYNTSFELTIGDIDLIESGLVRHKKDLSLERVEMMARNAAESEMEEINTKLANIHDLLGRLHNQKVFYRPQATPETPYVGG